MRLWHEALLPYLPRQQLLGQHRECCALRGRGWGKKHATVNYVFEHSRIALVVYHIRVMREMERRGYKPDPAWYSIEYRGKLCDSDNYSLSKHVLGNPELWCVPVYLEHDDQYLKECLENLAGKGIQIDMEEKQ